MAEPYRPQTSPGGSTALRGASPEAFGAGIGRALEDVGGTARAIAEREKARNRDSETAAAALEFATVSAELDKAEFDFRDNAAPGAAGHSEAIGKTADERINTALGKIKDDRVRDAFKARYADLRGNAFSRAYGFERVKHSEHLVDQVGEATRTMATAQALNPDGVSFQISLETAATMWDELDVADDIKAKGKRQSQREIAVGFAQSMADQNPAAFLGDKKAGETGILDLVAPYLESEDIDKLRTRGQAELARLEAMERQKASLWEAAARDEISALGKRVSAADWSIKDEEFDAAQAAAEKMGDKSLLVDIANWRDLKTVSVETRDWTPAQWSAAVSAIEKIDPAKRTSGQAIRLKHLQDLRGGAEARFAANPQEWANSAGVPAPPIDWENPTPAQGEARLRWNQSFMRSTGSASALLNPQELEAFRQRAEAGVAGEIEVAQAMRTMFGVAGGKEALKQIDKGNARFAVMVALPANTAKDYQLGIEALKRNGKYGQKEPVNDLFAEYTPAILPELRGPMYDAARAIAAAELDRAGNSEPDADDVRTAFMRGLQRAGGATGTRGGFVRWGETPIWLPPELEKNDALSRLSRAGPVELVNAAVGTANAPATSPYYMGTDGKLVRYDAKGVAQLLKRGTLESVAPGIYRVRLEDGGHVVTKNGQLWQFDIRKLK